MKYVKCFCPELILGQYISNQNERKRKQSVLYLDKLEDFSEAHFIPSGRANNPLFLLIPDLGELQRAIDGRVGALHLTELEQ